LDEFELNWMNFYGWYDLVSMFVNDMKWWSILNKIWKHRNKVVFHNYIVDDAEVLTMAHIKVWLSLRVRVYIVLTQIGIFA